MNDYDEGYLAGISDLTMRPMAYRGCTPEFALGYVKAREDKIACASE